MAEQIAADSASPTAIPRRNGEPVFNEPWESRVFGMAVALSESGLYSWDEFRDRLIAEITAADASGDHGGYYERFLRALIALLAEKDVCTGDEIERAAAILSTQED